MTRPGDIYYSTANDSPNDQGVTRAGANVWSVSILALNYKTGELAWGYQMVHHDIWDYDASGQPAMINVKIDGKKVEGVVQANKDGVVLLRERCDRPAGVSDYEEPVTQLANEATYPTQPIPTMPPLYPLKASPEVIAQLQMRLDETYEAKKETAPKIINGGWHEEDILDPEHAAAEGISEIWNSGGDRWSPPAYNPTTGYYYGA